LGSAVVGTSALFSLVHGIQYSWRWQNLLLLLAVGMAFGCVRARTGSVIATTLIHAAYNATLFTALFATELRPEGM
jgi:membrane protease YdiL (CAAX protease family)